MYKNKQGKKVTGHPAGLARPASVGKLPVIRYLRETPFLIPFCVVKTIFRWCVDNELLRKHHLICPNDYYSDTVPFCSAPKGKASVLPSSL